MEDPIVPNLRLDRSGLGVALGDLEVEVMEVVWRSHPDEAITVRRVWDELYPERRILYTTVMNTMARLARKRLLVVHRREPAYVYRPAMSREAFIDRLVAGALERLLVNFGGPTADRLRGVGDPALHERLERLLELIERQRAGEEPD